MGSAGVAISNRRQPIEEENYPDWFHCHSSIAVQINVVYIAVSYQQFKTRQSDLYKTSISVS